MLTPPFSLLMRGIACLSLLWCLGGCGSGDRAEPARYPVSGTVTLDGMPLPEGKITFLTPEQGAIDSLDVKDGKFSGKAQSGDRRVEINAFRVETVNKDGMESEVQTSLIPPNYNQDSTLSAQVSEAGPNTFNFELKST